MVRVPSVAPPAIAGAPPAGEAAPAPVTNWVAFPPGDNCHAHYGGIRGSRPNPALLADFSAAGAGTEPILGKGPRVTLYASSNDKALLASRNLHGGYRRLGESGENIVVMRDLDGLPYQQIAEALDVPLATVKTRLLRARRELQRVVEAGVST